MNIEKKQGKQLLKLYRIQRYYTVPTLSGHIPLDFYQKKMYNMLQDQIDILSQEISGRAKTRIRKRCRERGISIPNFNLEGMFK